MFRSIPNHRFRRCAAACAAGFAVAVLALVSWQSAHALTAGDARGDVLEIRAAHLVNARQGWVAGRTQVLRSEDAGHSWIEVTPSRNEFATIAAAQFLDANEAWTVLATRSGAFALAHTRDAGSSWTISELPMKLVGDSTPLALHFADANDGWLMLRAPSSSNFQRGALLRTRDGGASWAVLPSPPIIDHIVFASADVGWLAGGPERDRLYATIDGGASWQRQPLPGIDAAGAVRVAYQLPQFRNTHEGTLALVVGEEGMAQLQVFDTRDGGKTWYRDASLPAQKADGARVPMSAVDAQTVVLAPRPAQLAVRSTGTWHSDPRIDGKLPPGGAITALEFTSAAHGWLLQQRGMCTEPKARCRQETRLYLTDDAGQNVVEITPQLASSNADAQDDSVFISNNHKGFDQCAAGTVSQMQAWWTSTPWSDANIYIGGENSACDTTNNARLTPAWIKAVFAQGWHLIPTWVGKQAPTSGCGGCSKLSTDSVTARTQGIAEANAAVAKARSIGLQLPTVIYYDMEGYSGSSVATAAFLDGWTERMHELGNTSGIYGGAGNASTDWYAVANRADAVWIAAWNGQASVFGISGLADSKWANQQRIHQYQGGHDETWNGVTFNIDSNYEDGPVAAVDCIFCDGFE